MNKVHHGWRSLVWLALCLALPVHAFELKPLQVSEQVYALVGSTDARTEENHGLNNTLGFIVTDSGVVMVSSGTNEQAVQLVNAAIATVTDKPVSHVINIGTQDHHWMGNYYFAANGAEVIALRRTVETQKQNTDAQLTRLEQGIREQIKTVKPQYAGTVIDADRHELMVGGVNLELLWPGKGHYAGDALLWLSQSRVLFTGDFVYMDRMLGIHPTSDVLGWNKSFQVIEGYNAKVIIPGHGKPTDLTGARRDTGDYLAWLVTNVGAAVDEWKEIDETIDGLSDAPQFKHLIHYDSWHRRNIHQTYLQMEGG